MGRYIANPHSGHLVSNDATDEGTMTVGTTHRDRAVLAKHQTHASARATAAFVVDYEIQVVVAGSADENPAVTDFHGETNAFQSTVQAPQRGPRLDGPAISSFFWAIQH